MVASIVDHLMFIVSNIMRPKTPQLNGLVERMSMILLERVRCMTSNSKLPKHLWGKTLYIVVHVINPTPIILDNEVSRQNLVRQKCKL